MIARGAGGGGRADLPQVEPMSADAPLEDILRALDDVGVVVLRGAAPTLLVARLHAEHARLLRAIEPDIESLQAEMRCATSMRAPPLALDFRVRLRLLAR